MKTANISGLALKQCDSIALGIQDSAQVEAHAISALHCRKLSVVSNMQRVTRTQQVCSWEPRQVYPTSGSCASLKHVCEQQMLTGAANAGVCMACGLR